MHRPIAGAGCAVVAALVVATAAAPAAQGAVIESSSAARQVPSGPSGGAAWSPVASIPAGAPFRSPAASIPSFSPAAHRTRDEPTPSAATAVPLHLLFRLGGDPQPADFGLVAGVAVAPDGSLYALDSTNQRVLHFGATGDLVDWWGGPGSSEGRFSVPAEPFPAGAAFGIAVGPDGSVYVADTGNHRVQRFGPKGSFLAAWGDAAGGSGEAPPLEAPDDVAAAADGSVYVHDSASGRIVRYGTAGTWRGEWRVGSWPPGSPCARDVTRALGIGVAPDGSVFVATNAGEADGPANGCVSRYDPDGRLIGQWTVARPAEVSTVAEQPGDVSVSPQGDVLVVVASSEIQRFSPDGRVLGPAVACGRQRCCGIAAIPGGGAWTGSFESIRRLADDGPAAEVVPGGPAPIGTFEEPSSIAVDRWGHVYVADAAQHRVQRFAPGGMFTMQWGGEGGEAGRFRMPGGVATDRATDTVYVADTGNHRVQIFSPAGSYRASLPAAGDEAARLSFPSGVATDGRGMVVVADTGNDRIAVFTGSGMFVRAFGQPGTGEGALESPRDVAIGCDGRVLVADAGHHRIAEFDIDGGFVGAMGSHGGGDGQFQDLAGIGAVPWCARGAMTRLYAVDAGGQLVHRFGADARAQMAWGGDGAGAGTVHGPADVAVGSDGRVFVADAGNQRVQVLGADGAFLDQWGPRRFGYTPPLRVPQLGEGDPANVGEVTFAPDGSLYVAEMASLSGERVLHFGAEGQYLGQLAFPRGERGPEDWNTIVDVDVGPGGSVHVLQRGDDESVEWFSRDGTNLGRWPARPMGSEPTAYSADALSVGPDGTVYLAGGEDLGLRRHEPSGALLTASLPRILGSITELAVGPSGDVYSIGRGGSWTPRFAVERFAPTGESIGEFGAQGIGPGEFAGDCDRDEIQCQILGLAVDASGRVYVGDPQRGRVVRFTREGAFVDALAPAEGSGLPWLVPRAMDVDPRPDETRIAYVQWWTSEVRVLGTKPHPGWRMEVFGNPDLAERPMAVAHVPDLAFAPYGRPPWPELPADGFSARFRWPGGPPPGTYRIRVRVDGGVRLWAGRRLVVDEWQAPAVDADVRVEVGSEAETGGALGPGGAGPADWILEYLDEPGSGTFDVRVERVDRPGTVYVPAALRRSSQPD